MNIETNTKFNIYLSYPINRKIYGRFYRQLANYTNIGIELRAWLIDWEKMDGLPRMTLYVPSEHEPFMHAAYMMKLLTQADILEINNRIIKTCKLLILFGDGDLAEGGNLKSEIMCATKHGIPIYTMPDLSPLAIDALKFTIQSILKAENSDEEIEE